MDKEISIAPKGTTTAVNVVVVPPPPNAAYEIVVKKPSIPNFGQNIFVAKNTGSVVKEGK